MRRVLARGAEAVGVAIFAAMFGIFLLQVFMRYVVNRPLGWTDEVTLTLYPWAIFWACAFVVPWRGHVAFDLLYEAASLPARRVFAVIGAALIVGLFVAALPTTVDFTLFMARDRTPVLGWRYDFVFACFPIFLAAVAARTAQRLVGLLRRGWEELL